MDRTVGRGGGAGWGSRGDGFVFIMVGDVKRKVEERRSTSVREAIFYFGCCKIGYRFLRKNQTMDLGGNHALWVQLRDLGWEPICGVDVRKFGQLLFYFLF